MFTYSRDDLIRKEQEDKEVECFKLLKKCVRVKHSPELEKLFEDNCGNPTYIVDFVKSIKTKKFQLAISIIGRDDDRICKEDFKVGFKLTGKKSYDYIPYIKMSFDKPDNVNLIHIQHAYLLFFNKHNKYEDSLAETLHQFKRFNKIKLFM